MDDVTIISYPGFRSTSLLSLVDARSRYMLPFGGKFRVVDFLLGGALASNARRTIIYSNYDDDLEDYVERYGPFKGTEFPRVKVMSREQTDTRICYELIMDSNTGYYIIHNGDNPGIIDFPQLMRRYHALKESAVLFKLKFDGKATMAHTCLVTDQKSILAAVNTAIEEERQSPSLFEMIINLIQIKGIEISQFPIEYWPIKRVTDYYFVNHAIFRSPELFDLLFRKSQIQSRIAIDKYANLGRYANISNSYISDGCDINGTVKNSIIFPGVVIGEKSVVRDSVILPGVRIGDGCTVARCVIDERTDPPDTGLTIGHRCRIGSEEENLRNSDYSRTLGRGITLIGRNTRIPDGSNVGGACYVAPGLAPGGAEGRITLYNGLSIVK